MAIVVEPWRIPPEGEDLAGEEESASLALTEDDEAQAAGPIVYDLHLQLAGHELIVTGATEASIRFTCSRCAVRFETTVRDPSFFCERALRDLHAPVDLTEEVRESIILAFPTYPTCRSACRGLCPRCGVNRNREQCGCTEQAEPMGSVFDCLDVMKRRHHGRTQKEKIEK